MLVYKRMSGVDFTSIWEIKILKELQGENILRLIKVYFDQGFLCIQMPYYKSDLSTVIKQHKGLSRNIRIFIYYQITKGLMTLHENFILHWDLKS